LYIDENVSSGDTVMESTVSSESIRAIVSLIVERYEPVKVILFGSYAYGKPTHESDIDLLIIKNTEKSPLERWMEVKKILREKSHDVPISPVVLNEKELRERLMLKDFFIDEILTRGTMLYG
jgi:uncharacterized protein